MASPGSATVVADRSGHAEPALVTPAATGIPFAKGHGTGNDFVLLPDADGAVDLTEELARALCDRRTGLGADGVLRVGRRDGLWFMDHRNADGSHAEMCGNGIRLFGRYLVDLGWAPAGTIDVLTRGGLRRVEVPTAGDVRVDMGPPAFDGIDRSVTPAAGAASAGTSVDMGNPHVVVGLGDLGALADLDLGEIPRVDPPLPHGTNVEFVVPTGERALRLRVHERGVGETASCGTGACAAAAAAASWAGVSGAWSWGVSVPGGELRVDWDGRTLFLSGPAVVIASGRVDVAALLGVAAA